MARVGRLAGALLAQTEDTYYLIGNTKMPCDWARAGFEPPLKLDAVETPFVRLCPIRPLGPTDFPGPHLVLEVEGERLPALLAEAFLIHRNGSVSERLWRLVTGQDEDEDETPDTVDARWLGEIPPAVWCIVRDAVLRCT